MIIRFNRVKKSCVVINTKRLNIKKIYLNNNRQVKNEHEGNLWYFKNSRTKGTLNKNSDIKNKLNILNLPFFSGRQISFWKSINSNEEFINRVLDHYKKVWSKNKLTPFHGDLTFSNIIFGEKYRDVKIIDWEYFRKKNYPWGLDACYFLISTITILKITK